MRDEIALLWQRNEWGDPPITLGHPMTHLSVFICRLVSTVRDTCRLVFSVCVLLSYYSLWNLKIHQHIQLSLKILQHMRKLLETSPRFLTRGGLDISPTKRRLSCFLLTIEIKKLKTTIELNSIENRYC